MKYQSNRFSKMKLLGNQQNDKLYICKFIEEAVDNEVDWHIEDWTQGISDHIKNSDCITKNF